MVQTLLPSQSSFPQTPHVRRLKRTYIVLYIFRRFYFQENFENRQIFFLKSHVFSHAQCMYTNRVYSIDFPVERKECDDTKIHLR